MKQIIKIAVFLVVLCSHSYSLDFVDNFKYSILNLIKSSIKQTKDLDVSVPTQDEINFQKQIKKNAYAFTDENQNISVPLSKTIVQSIIDSESAQQLQGDNFGIRLDGGSSSGHSTLEIENRSAFKSPIEAAKIKYSAGINIIYRTYPTSNTQVNLFAGYGLELNSERDGYTRAYFATTSPESGIYDSGHTNITTNRSEYLGLRIIVKKRHRIALIYKNLSNLSYSSPNFFIFEPFRKTITQIEGFVNVINNTYIFPGQNAQTLSNSESFLKNYQAFASYYFLF